jgi:hypothetical protein
MHDKKTHARRMPMSIAIWFLVLKMICARVSVTGLRARGRRRSQSE